MNRGWTLWKWPLAVAGASTAGLLSALLGDNSWDLFSWCALGTVALLCALVIRKI